MASNGSASSHITLNNGRQMPVVGLGTWQAAPGVVGAAVDAAVRVSRLPCSRSRAYCDAEFVM